MIKSDSKAIISLKLKTKHKKVWYLGEKWNFRELYHFHIYCRKVKTKCNIKGRDQLALYAKIQTYENF